MESPPGGLDPEERASMGLLEISARGQLLTAGTRAGETGASPGPCVSGYHLAEWLVSNWWRLHWEPKPAGQNVQEDHGRASAHSMATIGHGYV